MDDQTALFVLPAIKGEKDLSSSEVVAYLLREEFGLGTPFNAAFSDIIWWLDDRNQYPGLAHLFSME